MSLGNLRKLATRLHCGLFSKRDSVDDAYEYALGVAKGCGRSEAYVLTAIHVVMNTIGAEIKRELEKGK